MKNPVTYAEFHAPNLAEAKVFYSAVFGWEFQQFDNEEYYVVPKGEDGAISCGFMQSQDGQPRTVCTVQVPSLEKAVEDVKKHGGTIVVEKFTVPGVGYAVYFTDPGGQIIGLYEPDENAA